MVTAARRPKAKPYPVFSDGERSSYAAKISITVNERVLRDVKKQARHQKQTLSAYVSEALARDLRRAALKELVDAYEAEHGAFTEEELRRAREEWED